MPWSAGDETDAAIIDTTWGELQRLEAAPGVTTVGEIELVELLELGAVAVDRRTSGSFGGKTIPGSSLLSHDEILVRVGELDRGRVSILFCNGPQCQQ